MSLYTIPLEWSWPVNGQAFYGSVMSSVNNAAFTEVSAVFGTTTEDSFQVSLNANDYVVVYVNVRSSESGPVIATTRMTAYSNNVRTLVIPHDRAGFNIKADQVVSPGVFITKVIALCWVMQPSFEGVSVNLSQTAFITTFSAPNVHTMPTTLITYNTALTSIDLSAVTGMGDFLCIRNTALSTLSLAKLVSINSFQIEYSNLTELSLPLWTTANDGINISNNAELLSVSLPALVTCRRDLWTKQNIFYCRNNPKLTSLAIPNLKIEALGDGSKISYLVDCSGNALDQTSVNLVLSRCVASTWFRKGSVALNGGTNSAPSITGLANKAILEARGITVTVNS